MTELLACPLMLSLLSPSSVMSLEIEPKQPAGFAVWGSGVPAPWDQNAVPAGWTRVSIKDDPWRHIGPVNTVMPPLAEVDRRRGWVAFARHYCNPVLPETAPTPEELAAPWEMFA